jgi:hypothetical protein
LNTKVEDATAATVDGIVLSISKLYKAVIMHRSYKRGLSHITKGTFEAAKEALKDLPEPASETWRAVAMLAKQGWGTKEACELAVAALEAGLREKKFSRAGRLDIMSAIEELSEATTPQRIGRKAWLLATKIGRELEGANPVRTAEAA